MFVDGIAMMVITMPFIVPIMTNAHMDLVWMGVVICILIEVGLLTPPIGLNLYVLQGVTGEPIRDVIAGATPFILLQLLMIAVLYAWPSIALCCRLWSWGKKLPVAYARQIAVAMQLNRAWHRSFAPRRTPD